MNDTADTLRLPTRLDGALAALQAAVAVISGQAQALRPDPAAREREVAPQLTDRERKHAAGLMRVNHVGEICAQALYQAQALATRDQAMRAVFKRAAAEESDHLAWTRGRVDELGEHVSRLVPLWYGGAFAIGCLASALGDRLSLGFMAETEDQVEQHLLSHLDRLPAGDTVSRTIVEQMKTDEAGHARVARERGGSALPLPARLAMRLAARLMTSTAYYI